MSAFLMTRGGPWREARLESRSGYRGSSSGRPRWPPRRLPFLASCQMGRCLQGERSLMVTRPCCGSASDEAGMGPAFVNRRPEV